MSIDLALGVSLHIIGAVIWVGGMFFAYMVLRPSAAQLLEPPQRLNLWRAVFSRFFLWVWLAVLVMPATGFYLIFAKFGGFAGAPMYVHAMTGLGILMIMIYMHVFFAPFKRIKRCLDDNDIPGAAKQLNLIRLLVGLNTLIGLFTLFVGSGGIYLIP